LLKRAENIITKKAELVRDSKKIKNILSSLFPGKFLSPGISSKGELKKETLYFSVV